jgi:hypothetical protein
MGDVRIQPTHRSPSSRRPGLTSSSPATASASTIAAQTVRPSGGTLKAVVKAAAMLPVGAAPGIAGWKVMGQEARPDRAAPDRRGSH